MTHYALAGALFISLIAGCGGKTDPAVRTAAENIVQKGGSFTLHGLTIAVKAEPKIPKGNLDIQKVTLNGPKVGDKDIELLKPLNRLETLELQSSYITDAGFPFLSELKNLRELDLHGSQYFSDKGLESLSGLPKLSKLELSRTRVSNAAVDTLLSMKNLTQLHLNNTQISVDAGQKLRDGLPKCKIYGPK